MEHLSKLVLKNFLCYKKGVFHFSKGVNMFIGPSDHGKSAVIDALRKLITNRPMGSDFQSWWSNDTAIKGTFGNKTIIYQKKDKASYSIKNLETKKIIKLDAVGTTVPEQVSNILRIDPKLNIQRQLEKKSPIFLLCDSPGDIAKFLNEVADLGSIDTTLAAGKEDLKKDEKEKKAIDSLIKQKQKELKKFHYLEELKILVSGAEKIDKKIKLYSQQVESLEEYLHKISVYKKDISGIEEQLKIMPGVRKLLKKAKSIKQDADKLEKLSHGVTTIEKNKKELRMIQSKLLAKTEIRRGISLLSIIDQYESDIKKIKDYSASIKQTQIKVISIKNKIKKVKIDFRNNYPNICPFCKSKVNKRRLT